MKKANITRAALGRLPMYLEYVRSHADEPMLSASEMAREMGLGEVLVRKDLNAVCGEGRPKVGYPTKSLLADLEMALGRNGLEPVILVGVGGLGHALMQYAGFEQYGIQIAAGFDSDEEKVRALSAECSVYPMSALSSYCRSRAIRIGIITVPATAAQRVCDALVESGIRAIWNFAPRALSVPEGVVVKNENLAVSIAHLRLSLD